MKFLPRSSPKNTANNPNILLAIRFKNAHLYSPVLISDIVSNVNEENVVNPPNSPVKRNALAPAERLHVSAMLQQKPIRKEPITLTESIPKGKECSIERCIHVETPKRNTVPIAPPVISSKTFIIPFPFLVCFSPGWLKDPGKMVNDLGSQLLIG